MPSVILHENLIIEDRTVELTRHLFRKCTFRRCTLVVRNGGDVLPDFAFDDCQFLNCAWHLDYVIHDLESLARFIEHVVPALQGTVKGPT